jgi:hypothetical protein
MAINAIKVEFIANNYAICAYQPATPNMSFPQCSFRNTSPFCAFVDQIISVQNDETFLQEHFALSGKRCQVIFPARKPGAVESHRLAAARTIGVSQRRLKTTQVFR